MKKIEIHPELLNIDRMKSKPFTKKDFKEISAFIKADRKKMVSAIKKQRKVSPLNLRETD
jgi:hypothetical protein